MPPPPQGSQNTDCIGYFTAVLDLFNIPIRFLIKDVVTPVFIYVTMTAPLLLNICDCYSAKKSVQFNPCWTEILCIFRRKIQKSPATIYRMCGQWVGMVTGCRLNGSGFEPLSGGGARLAASIQTDTQDPPSLQCCR